MENPFSTQFDLTRYVRAIWKRKWMILFPAILFPMAGGYYSLGLRDQFKSNTLILVQPQKVPTQFVPTTVTTSIQERLQTISQQIFSRTRLEQVIQEYSLFQRERETRTSEEIIELMRSRIQLKVHRNDAFQLSYVDSNPRLAMLVTNKLASLFIEENLKVREQQAMGTSQFLADEIERYRARVQDKEKSIYQFKQKHMDELPDRLASNQARLNQLQNQLQINNQNINAAEDRRVRFQQQLADVEQRTQEQREIFEQRKRSQKTGQTAETTISDQLIQAFRSIEATEPAYVSEALNGIDAEIQKREQQLKAMSLRFTQKHPDVVRLQLEIATLQEEREKIRKEEENKRAARAREKSNKNIETRSELPNIAEINAELPPDYPPVYHELKREIPRVDAEIARLRAQNTEIQRAIEEYQRRIAAGPARQLELLQLSEDYDNVKSVLENLINKKLQADLSENLERKQKGEQFMILDPANLPEKPFYPRRLVYVGGGFAAGLALGFGLALLLDLLDTGMKTREELSSALDCPVLGLIPEIVTPSDVRRRWAWRLGSATAVAVCIFVTAGIVHLRVKPIPQAVADVYDQVRATHWTTTR